ncbi:MAG: hypothetical protein ACYSSI_06045 [Planctomycetota bacterium]
MKLTSLLMDSITEVLIKIVEFTKDRQKVLAQNITNIQKAGFEPKDLEVNTFTQVLNSALNEYTQNQRLVFHDTENIKFGEQGTFEARPVIDEYAKELLQDNLNEYLELQMNYLLENSLNQRIAAELLRQKQYISSSFD